MLKRRRLIFVVRSIKTALHALVLGSFATGAAHADAQFLGFDAEYSVNDQGNNVFMVYAVFNNADAVGLNVFNAEISTDGEFIHNDVLSGAGGTWNPTASYDIPGFADSGNDSYVTIGYGVGPLAPTNGTSLDPLWDTDGLGGTIPVGAGWFNGNPPNEQVASAFSGGIDGIGGFAVKVGQFVFSGDTFSFEAEMGANSGSGSEVIFGQDLFVFPNTPQPQDCNEDGIPDSEQIADGSFEDCDGNNLLDVCQRAQKITDSVDRTPEGPGDVIEFDLMSGQQTAEDVVLELEVTGALAANSAFMSVSLGDDFLDFAFITDGADCTPLTKEFIIPATQWNAAGDAGTRVLQITGINIPPATCNDPSTGIVVDIQGAKTDCDQNGVWDECDPDSDQDGRPDACDNCPSDPEKFEPGLCGCGVSDVDSDADGVPDCDDPCPLWPGSCDDPLTLFVGAGESIQMAIDVVTENGTIELTNGTFTPGETINLGGKALTLRGAVDGDGLPTTILDGEGLFPVLSCVQGEDSGTLLVNLEIRNGFNAFDIDGEGGLGGGLICVASSPRIMNCTFRDNTAEYAGGLYSSEASPEVTDCRFLGNTATNDGGAMWNDNGSAPSISNTLFEDNHAEKRGGAVFIDSSSAPTFSDCMFFLNTARHGGGMASQYSEPALTDCDFVRNESRSTDESIINWGGGLYNFSSNPSLTSCEFRSNTADQGGGMYSDQGAPFSEGCVFANNSSDSSGGGAYFKDTFATLDDCVIIENGANVSGGGLFFESSDATDNTLGNCTVCTNLPDQISGPYQDSTSNCIGAFCDSDEDGVFDCQDGCPDDPLKIEPGTCGCGTEDLDSDGDSLADCIDPCPLWAYGCSEDGLTLTVEPGQSIQTALNLTPEGGTIQLTAGTYSIDNAQGIVGNGRSFTLAGTFGPDGEPVTILDAQGSGRHLSFANGEDLDTVITGITFIGGASFNDGGSIVIVLGTSPSIIDCRFIENRSISGNGGAIAVLDGSPAIQLCDFIGNEAALSGGAMHFTTGNPTLTSCRVTDNIAGTGEGGIGGDTAVVNLSDNIICSNLPEQSDQVFENIIDEGGNCILADCGNDLDANGLPDACDPDCDGDGEPDTYELSTGQAIDCNFNGIPDTCDVVDGTEPDCNENGIPDECDVIDGTVQDVNDNMLPDVCELAEGDLNLDECVGGADLAIMLSLWGLPNPPLGDLNGDGVIDGIDIATLLSKWTDCP